MKGVKIGFIIAFVIVVIMGVKMIGSYNELVTLRNDVREQQAQIENVLQARLEKIPDLVSSVKAYTKHEEEVFETVAAARTGLETAMNSGDMSKMANANEELTNALTQLSVVVEAYPELKASQLYEDLNYEISGSVNRISQERRIYNQVVTKYNNRIESFPMNIVARMMGFERFEYFEASEEAHSTNVVNFD